MDSMYYYEVAPNRIIRQNAAVFTYSSEQPLAIGQIVLVEVGKKQQLRFQRLLVRFADRAANRRIALAAPVFLIRHA